MRRLLHIWEVRSLGFCASLNRSPFFWGWAVRRQAIVSAWPGEDRTICPAKKNTAVADIAHTDVIVAWDAGAPSASLTDATTK